MNLETDQDCQKGEESGRSSDCPLLSIVVPAYNEEAVLPSFHERVCRVIDRIDGPVEIIYVNDGSIDASLEMMMGLRTRDSRVGVVNLSRNFGKEIAMSAGLDHSRGKAVVVIDADLQDPPELIPELLAQFHEGYDVVYATRRQRSGETAFKKLSAKYFYRTIRSISTIDIPADTGDFRLLSRRAVDALCRLREQHRFMKGLFCWIGYRQTSVLYDRDPRESGTTKWNYWKLWNFAIEGITSFSIAPLKMASYLGIGTAVAAFVYALWIIYKTLRFGDPVAGYPSMMAVILFLGGVQLATLGIIGEYVGRVFNETKQRPLYFAESFHPSKPAREAGTGQPGQAAGKKGIKS